MRSTWVTVLAIGVGAIALGSVVLGIASPDGTVSPQDTATTSPAATTPAPASTEPEASASPDEPEPEGPTAALAPESTRGVWPGRPGDVDVTDDDVDWCPAVETSGSAGGVFSGAALDRAACEAVAFVFERRYSRLSLPRSSYEADQFEPTLGDLTSATADRVYRGRVDAFVASPHRSALRDALGLVLFSGDGTATDADHASAGNGRVFYGPAFSTKGYEDRAPWVNPEWSAVTLGLTSAKGAPAVMASFTASASAPVFDPASATDDMLTIPTRATFTLRPGPGDDWQIETWQITTGAASYDTLSIRN